MHHHRTARYEFAASGLPPDTFRVLHFDGDEAVSQCYRFEIHLASSDPEVDFAAVIDKPATLTLFRGDEPAEINGVVTDFEQAGMQDGQSEYPYLYRAVVRPRLWRLSLTSQSRIFQFLTVGEIVTKVLGESEVDLNFQLSESYEPREYCTQYKETDLDFVQRLLEYEGIYYYFDHVHDVQKGTSGSAVETVVIRDTASEDAVSIEPPSGVPYRQSAGLMSADGDEFIGAFVVRQQLVTAQAEVVNYNYRTAETPIAEKSDAHADQAAGRASEFAGGHTPTPARARALAAVRSEEIEASRLVMTGDGDVQRFRAGFAFDLKDHYRADLNQTYRITSVRHVGGQASAATGGEGSASLGYRNAFACVPASVAYRPARRTPEPRLPGILTARVETTGGDYAPVDEFGRYHVRFPFDQSGTAQAGATKAVRMAQPYTGPGYGHHFPVHAGTEMVVACVNGNVDRIVGLSTIWNSTETSPVTSGNATQNVLRSWGKNELRFDDKKGHEDVYLHATKNHTVSVVDSESVSVGGDRSQSVGHNETLSVGTDQKESIGSNLELTVGGNRDTKVGANDSLAVAGDRWALVTGTDQTDVSGNRGTVVAGSDAWSVAGERSASVDGNDETQVGGNQKTGVGGDFDVGVDGSARVAANGSIALLASGTGRFAADSNLTVESPTQVVIASDSEIILSCGGSSITLTPDGIVIDAVKVTSSASAAHEITGAMVSSKASGVNEVAGATVKLN